MGEVYLAHDVRLDREVALKLLPRRVTSNLDAIASFRREALTLASLTHPNIATVHGFEETPDGLLFLVLERVEGETLADRLGRSDLSLNDSLQICAQIAQALEAAHERRVIHRDVKPGNVMIGPRGLVKVLDFGIARRASAVARPGGPRTAPAPGAPTTTLESDEPGATIALPAPNRAPGAAGGTESGTILGTPGYMSPEEILGSDVDERADVFAFGCVLYECLAGRRAFSGATTVEIMSAVLDRRADLSALPENTPGRVRALIERCLERTPSERLASMRAARVELEEVLGIRRASALREGDGYSTPHNLPAQTTSFVGRAALLGECRGLFDSSRLLTLAGIGGSGKTRLALRLAASLLVEYPDGVWFVNLAQLADPGRVPDVAAAALAVPDEPGRTSLESLAGHVRDRQMLFVLDNCEEVLAGAALFATSLLRACPGTRVLATSRQALGLDGETVLAVPPLAIPIAGAPASVESLREFEAVELFLDRARAAQPDFELNSANAPAVAEICRRLDGIPLALELAAGRIRVLSAEQIRDRLDDRFRLLARPGSDPPSRRQTVKAVIQWSWDHLLPPEQDLMRRLAVFTGGWTLERAARVCAESGDEFEVLDLLTRLVEHSLVVVDASSGEARYRFLESVWQFALEQLEASDERAVLRERHLAIYLDLAEQSETALSGPAAAAQVAALVREEENLLAALAFSAHAEDGARRGLRLVTNIQRFWSMQGRYALGRRAFEMALAHPGAALPSPERAWALVRASGLALVQGDHEAARTELEESLEYWRTSGDPAGVPPAVLAGLGVVAMFQSRFEDALDLGEQSLAAYRRNGKSRGIGMALHNLGTIECGLGRPDYGLARFAAAVPILREVGDATTLAMCLSGFAASQARLGDLAGARLSLAESFELLDRMDTPRERLSALEALAEFALALGRHIPATRLAGAVDAARDALKAHQDPLEAAEWKRFHARLDGALGTAEAAERERAAGRSWTPERIRAEVALLLEGDAAS